MKRHAMDPIALVFGSIFFLLGGLFVVGGTDVPGMHVGRLWPIPLIALGLVIALTAVHALISRGSDPDPNGPESPED